MITLLDDYHSNHICMVIHVFVVDIISTLVIILVGMTSHMMQDKASQSL